MPGEIARPPLPLGARPWPKIWSAGSPICRSMPAAPPCPIARSSGRAAGRRPPGWCSWPPSRPRWPSVESPSRHVSRATWPRRAWRCWRRRRNDANSRTELVESRERKLRMEEDQYFQAIVAADQAFAANDPTQAERLLADCPPRLRNWEWRHLNRRLHCELLTIQGHSGFLCPDFRPDTTSVECRAEALSGSIWDAAGGPKLRRMHGPDGTAYGVALDRAGIRIGHGRFRWPGEGLGHDSRAVAPRLPRS